MLDEIWWILCIGLGALALLFVLVLLYRTSGGILKLKSYPATCDLIDYGMLLEDNLILLKSGGLMSMYKIELPDLSLQPQAKLNHVYDVVQQSLLRLEGNYCVHIDIVRNQHRGYEPFLEVAHPVLSDIESQRARLFNAQGSYYSELFLTITYIGDAKTSAYVESMMLAGATKDTITTDYQLIQNFKETCADVILSLQQSFQVRALTSKTICPINESLSNAGSALVNVFQRSSSFQNAASISPQPTPQRSPQSLHQPLTQLSPHSPSSAQARSPAQPTTQAAPLSTALATLPDKAHTNTPIPTPVLAIAPVPVSAQVHNLTSRANIAQLDKTNELANEQALANGLANELCSANGLGLANGDDAATVSELELPELKLPELELPEVEIPEPTNALSLQLEAQDQAIAQELANWSLLNPSLANTFLDSETGPQDNPEKADNLESYPLMHVHEGLSFLQSCLSGDWRAVSAPKQLSYIDALLSYADYHHGSTPKLGDNYICVIALDGLPESSAQGMLNKLSNLPFTCRFSTRFVYFSPQQSQMLLERFHRYWSQRARTIISQFLNLTQFRQNRNAEDKRSALDDAKKSLDNHELVFGSYTANLVIMHPDPHRLAEEANEAMKLIETLGFGARIESINATEAFLGSLPGHYYENLRRAVVSQDVLADLIPLSAPARGEKYAPNPLYGANKSPLMQVCSSDFGSYLLNLHDQDLGNTIVIGPPGSGKSVLLGEFILNLLRYRNMRVFAFDKDYSFYALTKALGGLHIELDGKIPSLCPLLDLQTKTHFEYAESFLRTLYNLSKTELSSEDQDELSQCIRLLAENNFDHDLSSFNLLLSTENLRQGLEPFINSPEQLSIIDSKENLSFHSFLTTFECGELFKSQPLMSVLVLKQLFHLIEAQFDGHPAAIVLDEAWLMLQHPVFAEEVLRWIKTLRKFNVIIILATQTLNDLEISEHYNNLLECAKTRVYLANYAASNLPVAQYYSQLGLSPKEIFALSRARAKRDYFFVKGNQHLMFKLMLSQDELNLLSLAGAHNKSKVDELYDQYGPLFYHHVA